MFVGKSPPNFGIHLSKNLNLILGGNGNAAKQNNES